MKKRLPKQTRIGHQMPFGSPVAYTTTKMHRKLSAKGRYPRLARACLKIGGELSVTAEGTPFCVLRWPLSSLCEKSTWRSVSNDMSKRVCTKKMFKEPMTAKQVQEFNREIQRLQRIDQKKAFTERRREEKREIAAWKKGEL